MAITVTYSFTNGTTADANEVNQNFTDLTTKATDKTGDTITGDLTLNDNVKLTLGTGGDADLYYDGTDVILNPVVVGTGDFVVSGASIEFDDNEGVTLGTGKDATLRYDGTDLIISPAVVGTGDVVVTGGGVEINDNESFILGTGKDATITYNGTDLTIAPAAVGVGDLIISGASVELDDSESLTLGTGKDATIAYNGTDLVISPAVVGSGDVYVSGGSVEVDDSESVTFGTGKDATISYNGTDLNINPQVVGSGNVNITAGNLVITSAGPHAFGGGATLDYVGFRVGGAFTSGGAATSAYRSLISGSLTGASGDTAMLSLCGIGSMLGVGAIQTQSAADTITQVCTLHLSEPAITVNGSATVTTASTLYIASAPTEGGSNYALFVDDGNTRLDGSLDVRGTDGHSFGGSPNSTVASYFQGASTGKIYGTLTARALTGLASQAIYGNYFADTHIAGSGTIARIAQVAVVEPVITTGGGTITEACSLYIPSAPTEASANYALLVDSGDTRLDGGLFLGGTSTNNKFSTASAGAGTTTMYIGNASINVTSDRRLKTDIVPSRFDALGALAKLSVVDYTWNDPSDVAFNNRNARGRWTGLVAQDVVEAIPFAVNAPRRESDRSLDYDSPDHWRIEAPAMVGVLVKAVQELTARLEALEARG